MARVEDEELCNINDRSKIDDLIRDYMGKEIKPGDVLVYAGRRKSTLFLKHMIVHEIIGDRIYGYSSEGRRIYIGANSKRVIVNAS